jgi:hypothetical protein
MQEASSDGIALTGDGTIDLRPVLESHIMGARIEQVRQLRFGCDGDGCVTDMRVLSDGRLRLTTTSGGDTFTWTWRPDWYRTAPNITIEDSYLQLRVTGATPDLATLAATIGHELGHTLGLCHGHDEECYELFSLEDAIRRHESSMSYGAPPGTLHLLASEWAQVSQYLACPPQGPIQVVASGGNGDAYFAAKYETSFTQAVDVRACGETTALPRTLVPLAAGDLLHSTGPGWGWLVAHVATSVVLAAVAAFVAARWPLRWDGR